MNGINPRRRNDTKMVIGMIRMIFEFSKHHRRQILLFSHFITLIVLSNILWNPQALLAQSDEQEDQEDLLDKGDIAELFEFGSGIFAAILLVLSLIAYKNVKSKRLLFVSAAFGLIAIRTILLKLDLFVPEIESSLLELLLAMMGFAALALFFFAIVKREKVKTKYIRT
jgi:hypothetical protein